MTSLALAAMIALALLVWWTYQREGETRRRQELCVHPPEQQKTLRVGKEHPMLGRLIPGARWVKKHCLACGWQRSLYSPSLQPWAEYQKEWDQETIDREAEFQARFQAHMNELAAKEKQGA